PAPAPVPARRSQEALHASAAEMAANDINAQLARLPSVERVMACAEVAPLVDAYGRTLVVDTVRKTLDDWRRQALAGVATEPPGIEQFTADLALRLTADAQGGLRAVFNLTGTVLHTNLGRALLPDDAVQAVVVALTQPVNLE